MPLSKWPPRWLTPVSDEAIARGDGEWAIDFAETFGSIGKDGIAGKVGEALLLRDWQKRLVERVYARDEDGGLQFRTALIGLPRKNGKSALSSAAFGLYSLIAEGIEGGEVVIAAAEKEQARIVFGEAKRMVESSELSEMVTLYKDSIYVPSTKSVMKVLSAEAYSKEGLNVSRAIIDELHAHPTRDLFDVLSLSMGNRGKLGQIVSITTAGTKTDITGHDSIAYSLYNYGKSIATGEVVDPTFFMAWWEAPENLDYKSKEAWDEANPGLDDLVSSDDMKSAAQRTPEAVFRTKRLNQWVNSFDAWLPTGLWDELVEPREVGPDETIFIGFDGSFNGDTTVLVGAIPGIDGEAPYIFLIRAWEKQPSDDDNWRVNTQEVEDEIISFCQAHPNVREIVCDPFRWQRSMEVLAEMGLPIVEYPSTQPTRMITACTKFFDVTTEKILRHDGNPLLARHIDNAVLKVDRLGGRIVKENRASSRRIDAAVAAVIAYDRASRIVTESAPPQFFI
jgi:phage terminase large subunit-like protein